MVLKNSESNEIKIGTVLHLTGDLAEFGEAFREGIELAIFEAREKGLDIVGVYEDTALDLKKAVSAAEKLTGIDNVDAAIVSTFTEIAVAGPVFERERVPSITLWDSNQDIADIGEYAFAVGLWTPAAGEITAEYVVEELDARKAVVFTNQNEWSETTSRGFIEAFSLLNGDVLLKEDFPPGSNEFRTSVTKALALKPDIIFAPVIDNVPELLAEIKEQGYQGIIVTSDSVSEDLISEIGKDFFEGIYQTQATSPLSTETQAMIDIYQELYGRKPRHVLLTAWGYDSANIILKAVGEGYRTSEEIKNYLYTIDRYEGASGIITIDESGISRSKPGLFIIENGTFNRVK